MGNDAVRLVLRTSYYEKAKEIEYAAPPVGHFKTETRWCVCRGDSRICLIGWHGGTKNQSGGVHRKSHVSQHNWDDIKMTLHLCLDNSSLYL